MRALRPYNSRKPRTFLSHAGAPEVETTRRGLLPHVVGRRIRDVVVRNASLRWPVPRDLRSRLRGETRATPSAAAANTCSSISTRATCWCTSACRGASRWCREDTPPRAHDHVDLQLEDHRALRLTDPRRFGAVLWLDAPAEDHRAAARTSALEPFDAGFNGDGDARLGARAAAWRSSSSS